MNEEEIKRIVGSIQGHLDDRISKSHASNVSVFSNLGGKLLTEMSIVKEKQTETNEHLKRLNGQVATHAKEIVALKVVDAEILGALKPVKDFDKRIRYAENKIWYIVGIGVGAMAIFGFTGWIWFNAIQDNIQNSTKTAVIEYMDGRDFEGYINN